MFLVVNLLGYFNNFSVGATQVPPVPSKKNQQMQIHFLMHQESTPSLASVLPSLSSMHRSLQAAVVDSTHSCATSDGRCIIGFNSQPEQIKVLCVDTKEGVTDALLFSFV